MRPRLALFAAVLAAVVAVPIVLGAAPRQALERHVYVSVTNKDQAPIEGLGPSDFVVRENGVAREVLRVAPAPPPTHVGLLVDDSEAAQASITELRQGLSAFVRDLAGVQPEPLIGLSTFGERPTRVVPYTVDPGPVLQQIGRLFSRPNSGSYLLDAIVDETNELRRQQAARPVVVAVVIEAGPEFSTAIHQRVADALKAAGASLWTVVLQTGSQSLGTPEARERAQVLTDVARASGGDARVVLSRQALSTALPDVAKRLLSRYDVVYARPDTLIPPDKLQVEVKREGARVAAPTWTGK